MRGSRKFSRGGGGGGGEGGPIPRKSLTENFNMTKINNLAIPGGSGPPVSTPPGSAHAHLKYRMYKTAQKCYWLIFQIQSVLNCFARLNTKLNDVKCRKCQRALKLG